MIRPPSNQYGHIATVDLRALNGFLLQHRNAAVLSVDAIKGYAVVKFIDELESNAENPASND